MYVRGSEYKGICKCSLPGQFAHGREKVVNFSYPDLLSMGIFESSDQPSRGSLDIDAFFNLSKLPTIVTEWAAIIPLALHLASFRTEYYTTGQIAFLGRVSVALFPKLGVLSSLSSLCKNGPEYLDQVS